MKTGRIPARALLLAGLLIAAPETVGKIPEALPSDFSRGLTHWSIEQGLPTEIVTSLAQTRDGFLWVGNFESLARFDGIEFETFSGKDHSALDGMNVYELALKENYDLWIRGLNGTIAFEQDGSFHRLGEDEGFPSKGAEKIGSDSRGNLCFRGRDGFFYRVSGAEVERLPISGIKSGLVDVMAVTEEGAWLVHDKSRELLFAAVDQDAVVVDLPDAPGNLKAGRFFKLADGSLALTSNYGAYQFKNGKWNAYRILEESITPSGRGILDACQTPDGVLWIGTYPLGVLILPSDGILRRLDPSLVVDTYIRSIIADREGNVWFGNSIGLFRLHEMPFKNHAIGQGIERPRIESIVSTPEAVWLCTPSAVYKIPHDSSHAEEVPLPRNCYPVRLGTGGDGSVLVGNINGGVVSIKNDHARLVVEHKARTTEVQMDRQGRIWFATERELLLLTDDRVRKAGMVGLKAPYHVRQLIADVDGLMHCVVEGAGVFQLKGDRWHPLTSPEGRGSFKPIAITFDAGNTIWAIGAGDTLAVYENPAWKVLKAPRSSEPEGYRGVVADHRGFLWINTALGVIRVDQEHLMNPLLVAEHDSIGVRRFYKDDGLGSLVGSHSATNVCHDHKGRIWVATLNGAAHIDPAREEERASLRPDPLPWIESIEIDSKPVSLEAAIEIPPNSGSFEIAYSGTLLGHPDYARYRYRLLGHNEAWIDAEKGKSALFLKPSPGDYTFEVKAIGSDGLISPTTASLPIRVLPHWWESTWVRVGGILGLGGLVSWILYGLFRSLREKNARQEVFARRILGAQESERKRIAQELHDSLGQELLILKARAELSVREDPTSGEAMLGFAGKLGEALDQTRRISYNLRPPHLEMFGLSPLLEGLAEEVATASGIKVTHAIDEIEPRLDPDVEIGLYRISQEALANAIKYSKSDLIELTLIKKDGRVTLIIADHGQGFDSISARTGESLGLTGMEQRAQLMGGRFDCHSRPGEGTRVSVSVVAGRG